MPGGDEAPLPAVTLSAFLRPEGLLALVVWTFLVLSAVQLTVRLIMAFSVRTTLRGTLLLAGLAYPVAAAYDLLAGPAPSFGTRLGWAWVPMLLMALAGYATARWALRFKRTRGRVVAAVMIGLLAPHLFTLAPPLGP